MMFVSRLLLALALTQGAVRPPEGDLALTVGCGPTRNEILLTITNGGSADTAVLLGYALANGGRYLPREVIVEIKRSSTADFEQLSYVGPAGIAGRIDHWVVTLPAKARYALPLRATDFASATARFRPLAGPPEELRVRLTGRAITSDLSLDMAGMKLWRVWTGTAVSNSLRVAAECVR
jgi:hypothetical protein